MTLLEALLLAVIQGLTEFLPVSSSGHLVVGEALLDSDLGGAEKEAYFVLLHVASLVAVVVWFASDIVSLLRRGDRWRSMAAVVIGCIPAGLFAVGLKLAGSKALFDTPWIAGVGWIACGLFLFVARSPYPDDDGGDEGWHVFDPKAPLPVGKLVAIGLAQAAAIIPGVSRSGSTIGMAMRLGMSRNDAFRYSFLMALPLILGAQLFELDALGSLSEAAGNVTLVSAAVVCFLVSIGALGILRYFVRVSRLHWFAPYCLLAGATTLVLVWMGVI